MRHPFDPAAADMAPLDLQRAEGASRPVLDPVRVMVIDPDAPRRAGLVRAIDGDRDLAVVAAVGDARLGSLDLSYAMPDLIVIGLSPEDDLCKRLVSRLRQENSAAGVLIVGAAEETAPVARPAWCREIVERIRSVGLSRRAARSGEPMIAAWRPVRAPARLN